jgi:hypothetical protein
VLKIVACSSQFPSVLSRLVPSIKKHDVFPNKLDVADDDCVVEIDVVTVEVAVEVAIPPPHAQHINLASIVVPGGLAYDAYVSPANHPTPYEPSSKQ